MITYDRTRKPRNRKETVQCTGVLFLGLKFADIQHKCKRRQAVKGRVLKAMQHTGLKRIYYQVAIHGQCQLCLGHWKANEGLHITI